jgi:hypothetical protein
MEVRRDQQMEFSLGKGGCKEEGVAENEAPLCGS